MLIFNSSLSKNIATTTTTHDPKTLSQSKPHLKRSAVHPKTLTSANKSFLKSLNFKLKTK